MWVSDLEPQDADEKQTKVRLAIAVNQILRARRLSRVVAAHVQPAEDFGSGKLQAGSIFRRTAHAFSEYA